MSNKRKKSDPFSIDEFPTINVQDDQGNLMSQYGKEEAQKILDSVASQFVGKSKDKKQDS